MHQHVLNCNEPEKTKNKTKQNKNPPRTATKNHGQLVISSLLQGQSIASQMAILGRTKLYYHRASLPTTTRAMSSSFFRASRRSSFGKARSLHRHLLHQRPHERRRVLDGNSVKDQTVAQEDVDETKGR